MAEVIDRAAAGRAAIEDRRWREGYELLSSAAAEDELPPEDLELLAWSAYFTDQIAQVVPILERAYTGYVAAGNKVRAAVVAVQLSHEYGSVRLQKAVGSGWLARAARLLEDEPEGVAHGYLALERGLKALSADDYEAAAELGATAERVGREHADLGLELRGRQRRAVALIYLGDVDEGRALVNEVNAAAYTSGALRPYDTVVLYCNAIGTCRDVAAFDEASQWTERAELFCDANAISAFPGVCRVNRAEVLRFEGKLEDAERAASEACELLVSWAPRIAGAGFVEVGEARLRLGDLAKAEEAFDEADALGIDPEPGRSLLLLARGKPAAALASIRRALGDEPPPLARARMLPAFVEIAVATGALDEAAAAAADLEEIARHYDTDALHAAAATAAGSAALAQEDPAGAVRSLRRALRLWQETNARYEAARTRVLLARAYRAGGDEHGAMHELAQAGSVFDQLGARVDAARVDELLGRAGTRVTMTFAFTDIVDSTRHLEHHGDANWGKLLRQHDELVRRLVAAEGGEVVDHTGDGFFLAFPTAERAVAAAVAIQRAAAGDLPFELRIGLHTAEATSLGDNYRGKGVHVAARIGGLARGEEIVASLATVAGLDGVRTGASRSELLKGIAEPVEVVDVDWRGTT